MLRLSAFSYIFIVCNFMYNSSSFCVLIPYVGCYRCFLSGSQLSQMVLVATLVTWLQSHGSFTHPQDSQFPLEALVQVLLPIMWWNKRMLLSYYGMPFHVVSLSWKLDLTLNWQFPSSMDLIRCKTLPCCVSFFRLDYLKEILILLHLIIFHEIKIH